MGYCKLEVTMKRFTVLAPLALAAAFSSSPASAAVIVNGGFEAQSGSIPDGTDAFVNPTGWNTTNILIAVGFWGTAVPPEGRIFALIGNGSDQPGDSLSQTINGLTAGQSYKVTFELGGENWHAPGSVETVNVSMLDGSSSLSEIFNAPTSSNVCNTCGPGDSVLWDHWSFFTYDFLATATSATIQFQQTDATQSFGDTGLDNVSIAPIVVGVPEPITLGVFGAGLGAIFLRRRRKAA
jgi:hypothetical protein